MGLQQIGGNPGLGDSEFDPANPGPIGSTTPAAGMFSTLESADSVPIDDIEVTWGDSGTVHKALRLKVIDNGSHADSAIIELLLGELVRLALRKDGRLFATSVRVGTNASDTSVIELAGGGAIKSQYNNMSIHCPLSGKIFILKLNESPSGSSPSIEGGNGAPVKLKHPAQPVLLEGTNRAAYSTTASDIAAALVAHGIMSAP